MTTDFKLLRARLEKERKHLTGELALLQASARPLDERREGSPFGKREEEATETFELEKRLALEKQMKDQLVEVVHSLHKHKEGTYGFCDVCGQAIDPARLEALPQANMCMSCKSKQEKNAKGR